LLDLLYVGDLEGRLWRIDLTDLRLLSAPPSGRWSNKIDVAAGSGKPFLLFQTPQPVAPATTPFFPIYYRPTAVSLGFTVSGKPALGIAFGTGDRDDIIATVDPGSLTYKQRFYYVVDTANTVTRTEGDLYDITSSSAASTSTVPANGWFIELSNGERIITDSLASNGIIFFTTFTPPTAQTGSGACSNPAKCGSLAAGTARLFRVIYSTGNPYIGSDRAEVQQYGDFLSEPVYFQSTDQSGNIMFTTENTVKTENAPGGKRTTVKSWKERSRRP
jgi:Tfp pilus tip-associated adhesin PilY1